MSVWQPPEDAMHITTDVSIRVSPLRTCKWKLTYMITKCSATLRESIAVPTTDDVEWDRKTFSNGQNVRFWNVQSDWVKLQKCPPGQLITWPRFKRAPFERNTHQSAQSCSARSQKFMPASQKPTNGPYPEPVESISPLSRTHLAEIQLSTVLSRDFWPKFCTHFLFPCAWTYNIRYSHLYRLCKATHSFVPTNSW
jgi:hypothetical protein